MEYRIFNDKFEAIFSDLGAEIRQFNSLESGEKYLWCADKSIWGGVSPILFPFVGPLKNKSWVYMGKAFSSERHGFARTSQFKAFVIDNQNIEFVLNSDEKTKLLYPFEFEFRVKYSLCDSTLATRFTIKNLDIKPIFYALGGHTAFATEGGDGMNECEVDFLIEDDYFDNMVNMDTCFINHEKRHLFSGRKLKLSQELFCNDAVILNNLKTDSVILSRNGKNIIKFDFNGFPVLALWKKDITNRFICIEPWTDLPESVSAPSDIDKKPNLLCLDKNGLAKYCYSFTIL